MKDKHTPGPWTANEYGEILHDGKIIGNACSSHVDLSQGFAVSFPEEANARLMAAAPEMKEELKECRKVLKHLTFYYENVLGDRIQTLETRLVNIELLLAKIEGEQ